MITGNTRQITVAIISMIFMLFPDYVITPCSNLRFERLEYQIPIFSYKPGADDPDPATRVSAGLGFCFSGSHGFIVF